MSQSPQRLTTHSVGARTTCVVSPATPIVSGLRISSPRQFSMIQMFNLGYVSSICFRTFKNLSSPRFKGALRPLLEAIITAKITEELFMFLRSCNTKEEELKNLWLMSPSVRSAYLGGHIWARKLQFYEHEKPRVSSLLQQFRKYGFLCVGCTVAC